MSRALVAEISLSGPQGPRMVRALIDTGAQENFISQHVVAEEGLKAEPTSMGAHTVDGHRIAIYGRHAVETQATDAKGVTHSTTQIYLATDITGYGAILGYPWLIAANPDCH